MLNILKTLVMGANARAEDGLADHFAIDLIDQKIREADQGLAAAKATLASLILRQRSEERALALLETRLADLEGRARLALADGRDDLATPAAAAIAEIENERDIRRRTLGELANRAARTHAMVEKGHRRIVDLKQQMISARAVDAERKAQKRLDRTLGATAAVREAEAMIRRIMEQDEPLEQAGVLDEIDAGLDGTTARDHLAEAGYGPRQRVTAEDVLSRLRSTTPA